VLATDEASLYLQATTMRVWAPCGQPPLVRCDPSRDNTHFYGTLNLKTGRELVMQAETMNAEATAAYLQLILDTYENVPILLLWDWAPWHYGQEIRAVLEANPRLQLIVFLTAAPDLNPQEHVWKATRSAVSHNLAQRRLAGLAERFEAHLKDTTFHSSFLEQYGLVPRLSGFYLSYLLASKSANLRSHRAISSCDRLRATKGKK
jgi:transposase